jgi:UDP-2,3-diacylglucosamine hydrolase
VENRTKIYFASDVHLGSDFYENTRIVEKRFVSWLESIRQDAKTLYLLGDIFDYWFEYKHVVPKGFTRFLGKIAEMTDSGIEVHFFTGNHDIWLYDYLPEEIGVILHKKEYITEIYGKTFFLAHGDGLGDESISFRLIRSIFHNKICQRMYAWIHPRWSTAFAHKWSKYSRKEGLEKFVSSYMGEDKEYLVKFAKQYIQRDPSIDFFVFGHRHILLDLMLNRKSRVLIIGDWLQQFSYAVLDETGDISLEIFSLELQER